MPRLSTRDKPANYQRLLYASPIDCDKTKKRRRADLDPAVSAEQTRVLLERPSSSVSHAFGDMADIRQPYNNSELTELVTSQPRRGPCQSSKGDPAFNRSNLGCSCRTPSPASTLDTCLADCSRTRSRFIRCQLTAKSWVYHLDLHHAISLNTIKPNSNTCASDWSDCPYAWRPIITPIHSSLPKAGLAH